MRRVSPIRIAGEPFPAYRAGNRQLQYVPNDELPESDDVNGRLTAVVDAGHGRRAPSSAVTHDLVLANDDHAITRVGKLARALVRAAANVRRRRRAPSVSLMFTRPSRVPPG